MYYFGQSILLFFLINSQPMIAQAEDPNPVTEELVDFDEEEAESDLQTQKIIQKAAGGGHPGGPSGGSGIKLFVDLLVEHKRGDKNFAFRPNHFYAFVQTRISEDVSAMFHISDDPIFYELIWNITPQLHFKAGKLLAPFGTNEFHHIIGGRVDEESGFLPETWGDFGLGLNHFAYNGELLSVEYDLYLVNGFEGNDEPVIGAGDTSDNNMSKGLGTRLKMNFMGDISIVGSLYYDVWDADDKHKLVYYSVGGQINPGLVDLPILRRIRLRGEWARGEFQIPKRNEQQGLLKHAYARAGFYAEAQARIVDPVSFRLRAGILNPDNTTSDTNDISVIEPAFLFGTGKLTWTIAYQITTHPNKRYKPKKPADVIYAKFFLQY